LQELITAEVTSNYSGAGQTRALLVCGAVAGPLFMAVAVIQILTRKGFDLRRHDLSLLSNGDLGWTQIATYVVVGLLAIAAAVGIKRVLSSGPGRTWGPLLLGIYGLGWVGAGLFVPDPMNGFPPGTPNGLPTSVSWHSWMHLVSGGIGFLGLIVACFVLARRFASVGQHGWMVFSVIAGLVVLAAVGGASSGSQGAVLSVGLFVGGVFGWAWFSALSLHLIRESGDPRFAPSDQSHGG